VNPTAVLVVDDSEADRHALSVLLGAVGIHGVREAASGDEGVRIATETKPGVIILDARMPGMSGEETAKHLRAAVPGTRIVAFSAYVESAPAWADYFLKKDQLAEMVPLIKMVMGC
jgi:CheY-like chemotaxis protein